jgi:hypothetical protein
MKPETWSETLERRKFYPSSVQVKSITEEEQWAYLTKAQQQRVLARRRQAELFWTEAVAMREKGLNTQAALLERDAKRFDRMARSPLNVAAREIARQRYAPKGE